MIKVDPADEPPNFNARVRVPGLEAISSGSDPLPSYWRRCSQELLAAYNEVCAYSCLRIAGVTGSDSVDHFAPKSTSPEEAYEWTNYRLACTRMNSRKRDFSDVLDPFEIGDNWFRLDLVHGQISAAPALAVADEISVTDTIRRLKLNDEANCRERMQYLQYWLEGDLTFRLLSLWAPFVAREAERQGLVEVGIDDTGEAPSQPAGS